MVLIVPCSKICPHIAPSEGRIVSPRTNRVNIFYSFISTIVNISFCVAVTVTLSVSMVTLN